MGVDAVDPRPSLRSGTCHPTHQWGDSAMRQIVQHQLWIVLAGAVVFFTNLGSTDLWDLDEPLYASCAREMLQRGDWVVPRYNGGIFFDKPPLMFWMMMSGFEMFGINEFAARFWSAVLGIATALATYHIGRLLFRAEAGFWAGLCTVSTLIFTVSARAATVDCALTFVTTMAMLFFVINILIVSRQKNIHCSAADGTSAPATSERPCRLLLNFDWLLYVLIYACLGVAVLAKGPVGMLLPAASIGLYLLVMNQPQAVPRISGGLSQFRAPCEAWSDENGTVPLSSAKQKPENWFGRIARWLSAMARPFAPRNFLKSLWQMRPLTGVLVMGTIALPWYILVDLRTDGAWLEQFFGKYNFGPFLKPFMGHRGPFFYHFVAVLIGFFPWAMFMFPTILQTVRRIRDRHAWRPGYILISCWVGVFFVFWSACSTKLPHYVLPAYPALALLTGCFLHDWLAEPARVNRQWLINAGVGLVLVGLGIVVVIPFVTAIFAPGEGLIGLVGLILVFGGGLFLLLNKRGLQRHALVVFAATSVVFITAMFGFAAVCVDRHQNSAILVDEIRKASPDPQMAGFRFLQASMVYYAGESLPECNNIDELRRFLADSPRPFIVTTDEFLPEIERAFPGEFHVLAQQPRFLRPKVEILVLSRNDSIAPPRVAAKMTDERQ
jgi:4-amino-4-deoxy-L-arabinose transferase-like glycosyltransferase